jgi:hypothetical protein
MHVLFLGVTDGTRPLVATGRVNAWTGAMKGVSVRFLTVTFTAALLSALCSQFAFTIWIRRPRPLPLTISCQKLTFYCPIETDSL